MTNALKFRTTYSILFVCLKFALYVVITYEILPAEGGTAHGCMALHCTEPFILTLTSSLYNLNNVERELKDQIIIILKCLVEWQTV